MTDGDVLALLLLAGFTGGLAGLIASGAVWWIRTRWPNVILRGIDGTRVLDVDLQLRTRPIALQLQVPPLDPLTIPITTPAAPSVRELAERVLATVPDIGPTDLAAIAGCAKSTAKTIIDDWRSRAANPTT